MKLRINEIFHSLQGEARTVGLPTTFIRLTGCPLRCGYCDTAYAYGEGEWMSSEGILARISEFATRYVCVTGGEPLAQEGCRELLEALCERGYAVSLETSGARDIAGIDPRVSRVMDLKTPGSGELKSNRYENIDALTAHDQVKLVICDREDYNWAKEVLIRYELARRCEVLFSPAWGRIEPRQLADWILEDQLPVRFQLQLHKILWDDERAR
ncbi:7-carboxy-7-deazaguanine synthase QueE [Endothiovibrio diazotrophicus]